MGCRRLFATPCHPSDGYCTGLAALLHLPRGMGAGRSVESRHTRAKWHNHGQVGHGLKEILRTIQCYGRENHNYPRIFAAVPGTSISYLFVFGYIYIWGKELHTCIQGDTHGDIISNVKKHHPRIYHEWSRLLSNGASRTVDMEFDHLSVFPSTCA